MRWTLVWPMPIALAIVRALQCVALGSVSVAVFARTASRVSDDSGAVPGNRVLSRRRASMPSATNRSCHRHTHGFDFPVDRMIAIVPRPSAVARTIFALQTTLLG
jgi:hypothetical protein